MPSSTVAIKKNVKKHRSFVPKSEEDELEEWKKGRNLLKPKDQLELTDTELKEIIPRGLSSVNPQLPKNLVEFNHARMEFVSVPPPSNLVVVYENFGSTIPRDTEEARKQMIEMGIDPDEVEDEGVEEQTQTEAEAAGDAGSTTTAPEDKKEDEEKEEGSEKEPPKDEDEEEEEEKKPAKTEEEDEDADDVAPAEPAKQLSVRPSRIGKPVKLKNLFNFCERATLTYNLPRRNQETQTTPPPVGTFSANVLAWIIYDAYVADYNAQQLEKQLERERKEATKAPISKFQPRSQKKQHVKKKGTAASFRSQLSEEVQEHVFECWKVLERMINQNTYLEIAKDYRYWDDPSDEFRDEEGTLLPLWKYSYEKMFKCTVTNLMYSPSYYDMFLVCYGYLDFGKIKKEGALALFSYKNPSYPDNVCLTDSPVMCVDIHKSYSYMVVIGLYDGSVMVFNIQASSTIPAYTSNNLTNKHKGIVWAVKWAPDMPDGELNFISASSDGRVNNWVLLHSDLSVTTILTLYLERPPVLGPDGTQIRVTASISTLKLHPDKAHLYLVGTEEGWIYKCSTEYNSFYVFAWDAHNLTINDMSFNKYNSDIFMSCSCDWRIKIWEDNRKEPLFVFDLLDQVSDCKWAPYSSTVFAAVSSRGKVFVYDLNVNKYKPIAIQAIVSKKRNKLTKLSFNRKVPILIVGDDKGTVTSLKLSPNLRIPCKQPKKQNFDQFTLQVMKLDKLLALVREPVKLSLPEDTADKEED